MSDDQSYDLSRFKATYFEECAELLATAEETIARLQDGTGSADDLNALFRCVHSIKGGGGAFAFDDLVHFAHVFETSMDALRSGRAELTPHVADILVRGNDTLGDFVRAAQDGVTLPADHGSEVKAHLAAIISGEPAAPKAAAPVSAPPAAAAGFTTWTIRLAPAPGMLRTGNDPLLMIRELSGLGEMKVAADLSRLPALAEMDALNAYLAWTFTLVTDKGRNSIEEVFEFVAGDSADVTIEQIGKTVEAEDGDGWGLFAPLPPAPETAPAPPAAAPVAAAQPHPAAAKGGGDAGAAGIHTSSIRVDLDRVDRLVNMVGELVITQAMLGQQASGFSIESHPELVQGLQELSHHTRELQESVMAIRAQPVKALFSRAPRLVRDLSAKLGKQAKLVMSGETTEVDKTVIEQLSDPLTHLIRNSLDHGIEMPEERIANGKPAEGTIHLAAEHRSGRVIIQVSDDGKGIDRKRVLEKAVEKGLVERGAQLTDEQIDQMIFAPGFSTAAQVSDVSGRGVGMDVVRRNIQDVGGRVVVQSTPGQGSRFILSLPLTLAVMDGMLVAVGNQRYVLPLTNIVESLRPTPQQARTLVNVGDVLTLRGDYIRLIRLYDLFGIRNAITETTRGLVVVVETEGGDRIGLLVDELLGQQQVVIKSLDSNYRPVEGISAATILGDGRVALILDVGALRIMGERLNRAQGEAAIGAQAAE
ncbi:chemotaxis protein CheA [Magnetospirillum sp. SS-4]|uniref:chemotaxis protein CheA n=1 Tax=Magnetospirillum sp. SS-4 TaxID=2681465 RepID=UPI00137F3D6D|nr:chemotaxis protein CheA [Magnetospirillum sp. SS-4]CAA7618764.1 fused chemotactic sensory histidine kinase in two-component regulatory system with CheB and CheY: sensory histidine kinase; signal sensing protein [Magnetospirillum sp. SS-4]